MRLLLALSLVLAMVGCSTINGKARPLRDGQGEVYVFLEPVPKGLEEASLKVRKIEALSFDGQKRRLQLNVQEVSRVTVPRQRMLASGPLEPGRYRGVEISVDNISSSSGDPPGQPSTAPILVDHPFTIAADRVTTLFLSLEQKRSSDDPLAAMTFRPFPPPPVIVDLSGFVSNYRDDTVTVFDRQSRRVTGIIATGRGPKGLACDINRRRTYIAIAGGDEVSVVDAVSMVPISSIRLRSGDHPEELALVPDGTLLVVNNGSNSVSIIDTLNLSELERIKVGSAPSQILIEPNGRRAFILNSLSNNISIIDIGSRSLIGTIPLERTPVRAAFGRDESTLFLIERMSPYLTKINTATAAQERKFTGGMAASLAVNPANGFIYLAEDGGFLEMLEPFSLVSVDRIPVAGEVVHMALERERSNLYLINGPLRTLQIVNTVSNKIEDQLDVGEGAYRLSLMGVR